MPIWIYECEAGHQYEKIRHFLRRDDPMECHCGKPLKRQLSPPHIEPDGLYSFAPNIGDPERFERQRAAIQSGTKVIPRSYSKEDLARQADPQRPKGTFFGGGTRP